MESPSDSWEGKNFRGSEAVGQVGNAKGVMGSFSQDCICLQMSKHTTKTKGQ